MAWAQAYPARPVRIIAGQTAGGATHFLGGLSDASLDILPSMLVERRFDVGATVLAAGEPGSMFIVRSGELVVSKLGDSGA